MTPRPKEDRQRLYEAVVNRLSLIKPLLQTARKKPLTDHQAETGCLNIDQAIRILQVWKDDAS